MSIKGRVVICVTLFLAACSGLNSKQESELVENGFTAMSSGDYYTAELLTNQALSLNDKNPYALLNLGVIYQETERYDQARQTYQSVINLDPQESAVSTNVEGYSGLSLVEIARINLGNLPSSATETDTSADTSADTKVVDTDDSDDADADGVADELDQCPDTPAKAWVSADGCWTLTGIFPSGGVEVRPDAQDQLQQAMDILEEDPSLRLEIQGHTDNRGSVAANQRLSEGRAKSVMMYLIQQGVKPERLQWAGYGPTRPIASNDTPEGRAQNRRVQLNPIP